MWHFPQYLEDWRGSPGTQEGGKIRLHQLPTVNNA